MTSAQFEVNAQSVREEPLSAFFDPFATFLLLAECYFHVPLDVAVNDNNYH